MNRLIPYAVILSGLLILGTGAGEARMLTQLTPVLTVSEEYRSNYFNTAEDETGEFISTCQLGFSAAFIERTRQIYIGYFPKYRDYDRLDEKDSLDHAVTLDGTFQPHRQTTVTAHLGYDGHSEDETGGSSSREVSIQAAHQLFRHTALSFDQDYSRSYDQQIRTGEFKVHDVSTTRAGLRYQFGRSSAVSADYSFSFDTYRDQDSDEYQTHEWSGLLTYWMTAFWGLDIGVSIEDTDYTYDPDDPLTVSGHAQINRKINRHLEYYMKYAHTHTRETSGNHTVCHPSAGIFWEPAADSGVRIGAGVLIETWEAFPESDDENLFFDLDVYKDFHFSPRGTISIEAASGYTQTSPGAASLGFNTFYEAGLALDYRLTRRMTGRLGVAYTQSRYDSPTVGRKDDTVESTAGLNWTPLKWMTVNFSYRFSDFKTSEALRDSTTSHTVMLSLTFTPETPLRIKEQ